MLAYANIKRHGWCDCIMTVGTIITIEIGANIKKSFDEYDGFRPRTYWNDGF